MGRPSLGQQGPPDCFGRIVTEAVRFAFECFLGSCCCLASSEINVKHSTAQSVPSFGECNCRCDWYK